MATITSSTIIQDETRRDSRRDIVERHVDSLGVVYIFAYVAPNAGWNAATVLAARAIALLITLATAEIASNISQVSTLGFPAVVTFHYSIVADNVAALRVFYATATQTQAVFIGDYLASLTDVQLENAFGLTALQVTTLRTNKLTPAVALAASLRLAAGQ